MINEFAQQQRACQAAHSCCCFYFFPCCCSWQQLQCIVLQLLVLSVKRLFKPPIIIWKQSPANMGSVNHHRHAHTKKKTQTTSVELKILIVQLPQLFFWAVWPKGCCHILSYNWYDNALQQTRNHKAKNSCNNCNIAAAAARKKSWSMTLLF